MQDPVYTAKRLEWLESVLVELLSAIMRAPTQADISIAAGVAWSELTTEQYVD